MILNLIPNDTPTLKQITEMFDFKNPFVDPIQLAKDLYETMMSHQALGLAAPQVGIPCRAFAMRTVPGIVCFNPRIVDTSSTAIMLEEGCASFPNLFVKIKRPKTIKVRYNEPNGVVVTRVFEGMTARCFMHELDHLNGVLYTEKANPIHIDRALRKRKQINRLVKRENKKEQR